MQHFMALTMCMPDFFMQLAMGELVILQIEKFKIIPKSTQLDGKADMLHETHIHLNFLIK